MLRQRFFEAAATIRPSARGELEITDALQAMIDAGMEVGVSVVEENWIDTGSPRDLLTANRMLLGDPRPEEGYVRLEGSPAEALVQVGAGVTLGGSTVNGPAIIGRETQVVDSRIGPGMSLGECCRIGASSIEESIVMDGAVVEGARLRNSIVGHNAVVRAKGDQVFEGLLLGDEGRVELE
jgi:glucose-1-phosphate thymidylyltransferase